MHESVEKDTVTLSVIAPLYNEQESVEPLYNAIVDALKDIQVEYEILFVDDGSKDQTVAIATQLAQKDHRLHVVEFARNFGQTPAMAAGIDLAKGSILATMDGDLQNDPSDIPMMLDKLNEGYDIVVGWRHKRQDKMITRKIPSMIANRLIGKITGVPIKDNGCSLKVYRAELMKKIPFYNEMHRFIPALLSLSGAKVAQVRVKHHARQFGESKYGLSRIYKVIIDILTIKTILSLISHPIRWFVRLAIIPMILSFVFLAICISDLVAGNSIVITSSMMIIFLCLSVFLTSLGFLCELIYNQGNFKLKELAPLTSRSG